MHLIAFAVIRSVSPSSTMSIHLQQTYPVYVSHRRTQTLKSVHIQQAGSLKQSSQTVQDGCNMFVYNQLASPADDTYCIW